MVIHCFSSYANVANYGLEDYTRCFLCHILTLHIFCVCNKSYCWYYIYVQKQANPGSFSVDNLPFATAPQGGAKGKYSCFHSAGILSLRGAVLQFEVELGNGKAVVTYEQ